MLKEHCQVIILPMSLNAISYQTRGYKVATPAFEGPLDLLLQLIERAELDITRLALAQVTDQYLEHLRNMVVLPAEEVSAFLVIAAKLLQIKSEVLLPRPPSREEGEENPGEALARQLLLYRQFKRVADGLEQREHAGLRSYLHLAATQRPAAALDLSGVGLLDLIHAARMILFDEDDRAELRTVVSPPVVTIREKIHHIATLLRRKGQMTFHSLLSSSHSRIEIVVTFLALLELIKRHMVRVEQAVRFGEIEIEQSELWDGNEEFELEFGE